MSTIGERIKEVRKNNNMNQLDFSNELGISQAHLSSLENGKDNPSSTLIKFISLRFNIEEEWLKTEEGSASKFSNWCIDTDDGCNKKYLMMRNYLDGLVKNNHGLELQYITESFAYFVNIMVNCEKIDGEHKKNFLNSIQNVFDSFEKIAFHTKRLGDYKSIKNNANELLRYLSNYNRRKDNMDKNLKKALNIYLDYLGISPLI